jgi:hypothetical protein
MRDFERSSSGLLVPRQRPIGRAPLELQARMFMGYGAAGAPAFTVDAADFDGTNDNLLRSSALTGTNSDSKTGWMVFWFKPDDQGSGVDPDMLFSCEDASGEFIFGVQYDTLTLALFGATAGGSLTVLEVEADIPPSTSAWQCCLFSWDQSAAVCHLYIGDTNHIGGSTLTNTNVSYSTITRLQVGGEAAFPGQRINSGVAEFSWAPGQSIIDFSVEANRRKFIGADGKPVNPGSTGSTPTGTAPKIYLHLDDGEAPANFATNRSGNGDFSVVGALTTYASSPAD